MVTRFLDFFFFKQKTAYEMRISDWSSDVCSSDLLYAGAVAQPDIEQAIPVVELRIVEKIPGLRHGSRRNAVVHQPTHQFLAVELPHYVRKGLPRDVMRRQHIGRASCRERVCQYV